MFLCLQCNGEYERLTDDELAFSLRIDTAELVKTRKVFEAKGFIDDSGKIVNWNKRQFKSDSSTERVRKHRKNRSNGDETLQKRPQIQTQITDTDSESKNISAAAPPTRKSVSRGAKPADPEWWLEFKLAYPDRAGDQGWQKARKAANARMAEGHTPTEFVEGAKRYAEFCAATQKTNTEFVKQAASFLGPEKSFLNPWTAPPRPLSVVEQVAQANPLRNHDERVVAEQFGSSSGLLEDPFGDVRQSSHAGLRRLGS